MRQATIAPITRRSTRPKRRQHHVAIPRALAVTHQNDATAAVDIFDPEPSDFRGAKPGGIGSRRRSAALQARDGFEKLHDLIGAEHNRQFARFARVRNPLGDCRLAERDAVEEPQSADDLVQPGDEMPVDTRWTWKAWTSSSVSLSGERPKYRLNFETALMYDRCVAGDMLLIVMSSIMRRRRGLISAISETPG